MQMYFLIIAFAGSVVMPEPYTFDECHAAGKAHDGAYRCVLAPRVGTGVDYETLIKSGRHIKLYPE